jgi:HEAT repeat protein
MTITDLQALYATAQRTDDFDVHTQLSAALLASNDADVLRFHYGALRDRSNHDLYLRLRAAFARRPVAAVGDFLLDCARTEREPTMRADVLHLLGMLQHPAALGLARAALRDANPELRQRGCYVLGWLGHARDIACLGEVLRHDPDPNVRRAAATSHRPFFEHARRSKAALLRSLSLALPSEQDADVVGWIVLSVQDLLGKRFGMRWNAAEDQLVGDSAAARDRSEAALRRRKA